MAEIQNQSVEAPVEMAMSKLVLEKDTVNVTTRINGNSAEMVLENARILKKSTILMHTGNIMSGSFTKKQLSLTPTEELCMCLDSTINNWVSSKSEDEKQELKTVSILEIQNNDNDKVASFTPEQRQEMKITVKVFLGQQEREEREDNHQSCRKWVEEALEKTMAELDTDYIDTVLLSIPPMKYNKDTLLDDVKEAWSALEEYVERDHVFSLGVSDLNTEQLTELYHWAKVKPTVAQMNLDLCCSIPENLQQFARRNNIQLLTHNDPKEILPSNRMKQQLSLDSFSGIETHDWNTLWVARYSMLIKHRGVLSSKGYIVKAERSTV